VNRAAIAVLAAGAITTAVAEQTLTQARWQLRDLRVLFATMEEDHSQLVKLYLDTRRRLHVVPAPDYGIAEQAEGDE